MPAEQGSTQNQKPEYEEPSLVDLEDVAGGMDEMTGVCDTGGSAPAICSSCDTGGSGLVSELSASE